MKHHERMAGIRKSPRLAWDVLVRGRYAFVYDQMPVVIRNMSLRKRINLFLSGANLLFRRSKPWSMPLHMQFELTNYCNLKCPVCPAGIRAIRRRPQNLSPRLFARLIEQAGPCLLTASLWGWGEPALHPQLREILKIARKRGFMTFLSTNGQNLCEERVIRAIIEHPPTYLIVAIDGLTDESNSVFRVGSRLEPALEGVRRLAELKKERSTELPILHMRFIVMKHNQHQVRDLQEFARSHGFDFLTVRTLSIIDTDSPDERHGSLIPQEESLRAYHYDAGGRMKKKDFYCLEPFWFPTVFADGTVVSCEQDYNAQLAMERVSEKNDFKSIWKSKRASEVRKQVRDQFDKISFCRNCPYRDRETTDVSIAAYPINTNIDFENLV